MPCFVAKLSKLINMVFIIQNCDARLSNKIDQVDENGFYYTKL